MLSSQRIFGDHSECNEPVLKWDAHQWTGHRGVVEPCERHYRANAEGEQLGLTAEELAFYDALTKPQAIKDFYEHRELIAITKELTELLRKNRTIDWQKKASARAGMRRLVKHLLKKHKYPPEGMEDAVQTVMSQCEMWVDNPAWQLDIEKNGTQITLSAVLCGGDVGFEPQRRRNRPTGFRIRTLQPLGYISI